MTEEAAHPIVRSSIPVRQFDDLGEVTVVAIFPDRRRMATNSSDGIVRIWDLNSGVVLMELEGDGAAMRYMALSRDGKFIASSDDDGYVVAWHGDTGRLLTHTFTNHAVCPLDFSPDGTTLAIGSSSDSTIQLWSTATWQPRRSESIPIQIHSNGYINCVRYSPDGELLAGAIRNDTYNKDRCINIWSAATRQLIATLSRKVTTSSLVWMPDGKRLLSADHDGHNIWEWDSSTWERGNHVWKGPTVSSCLAVNCNGTVIASQTPNNRVRLWRLSDRRTIAIFQHSDFPCCITFSLDGKHILVAGRDKKTSQWAVPEHAWPEDTSNDRVIFQGEGSDTNAQVSAIDSDDQGSGADDQGSETEILVMDTTVRNACMSGELTTAEELLTQEINLNGNNYRSYANRSVVMARKLEWDSALEDATKSLSIRPSLMGYITKGIALCGKKRVRDAKNAFDLASTFIDGGSKTYHLLFLIKSIALFSANQHGEAMDRVRELASTCRNADTILACRTLEVYLHIQLGNNALDRASLDEAAGHFTAAVNTGTFLSKSAHNSKYEEFVVFFGCDFTSLWQTANQRRCHALLRAGKLAEVFEAYRYMTNMSNESTKIDLLDWSLGFMQELSAFQSNARNAAAIPEIMMCRGEDDGKDSISDIDSDIDDIEDIVC